MLKRSGFFRKRFFVLLIVMILIPVIVIFALVINNIYRNTKAEISEVGNVVSYTEADYIEKYISFGINTLNALDQDEKLAAYLSATEPISLSDSINFFTYFRSTYLTKTGSSNVPKITMFESDKYLRGNMYVDLFCGNGQILYTDFLNGMDKLDPETVKLIHQSDSDLVWFFFEGKITIYKHIFYEREQPDAFARMTFDIGSLNRLSLNSAFSKGYMALIVNNTYYPFLRNTPESDAVFSALAEDENAPADAYILIQRELKNAYIRRGDARLAMLIPKSLITDRLLRQFPLYIFIFLIAVVVGIGVAFLASLTVTRRLYRLVDQLDRDTDELIEKNLDLKKLKRSDEFDIILNKIYELIDKLNEYNKSLTDIRLQKKQLELKLLQELFNPHFLYNSLSSLKYALPDNPQASELIDNMVGYYRGVLNNGRSRYALSDELTMLENYVKIQSFSYDIDLQFIIEADEEARACIIVKQLLQPFVENAFLHGVRTMDSGGIIKLTARVTEGRLHICITDNGRGIPGEKLKGLMDFSSEQERKSYGIYNSVQKLKNCYDEDYSLSIDSREGEGTTVDLVIPTTIFEGTAIV